jgi:hypothetical protein
MRRREIRAERLEKVKREGLDETGRALLIKALGYVLSSPPLLRRPAGRPQLKGDPLSRRPRPRGESSLVIPLFVRPGRSLSALLALPLVMSGCQSKSPPPAAGSGWALLVAVPDTVLLDTAGVAWVSSDARIWLRTERAKRIPQIPAGTAPVAIVETHHDISCERREVRDLEMRALSATGEVIGDSTVEPPSWTPASAHPWLQNLLPALCARLSQLHPRGLHSLLGSDRP